MDKLLIICGPTATGKTKLALQLANRLNGELISADSRQVYKNFDALTGKDRPENGDGEIHMYDIVDAGSDFNVGQYERMAQSIIGDIRKRGKLPIVVGGTGLYLKALTQPLPFIHIPPNRELRRKFQDQPKEVLQKELLKLDRKKWSQMNESDRNNPRRLIRALEIAHSDISLPPAQRDGDILWIGLTAPIDILQQRIAKRVKQRWDKATHEVAELVQTSSLVVLGFLEIRQYLAGTMTKAEAMRQWTVKERQYAKRQLTWFKKQPAIGWYDITSEGYKKKISGFVRQWYTDRR